jgi:hypothetical protein
MIQASGIGMNRPAAEVVEDRVVIWQLEVAQADVVRGAHRHASSENRDVTEFVVAALEVGAKALAVAGTTVDVEELRRSLDDFSSTVAKAAQRSVADIAASVEAVADAEGGTMITAVRGALLTLEDQLSSLLTGEEAPVRVAIRQVVESTMDRALAELQRAIANQSRTVNEALSNDNPSSPINALRVELLRSQTDHARTYQQQLQDLRSLVEAAAIRRQAMERTALKGVDYESALVTTLDRLARGTGDLVEATGSMPGLLGRSKKGDAVISGTIAGMRQTIRLVIEAKDASLGMEGWRKELDEARRNRGAVAALGVVRGVEHMPGNDRLRVIDPLSFVMAFDPEIDDDDLLLAAYQLLRAQAACVALEGAGEVDAGALRSQLAEAMDSLGRFDRVSRATEQAKAHLTTISLEAGRLREDLAAHLVRCLRLVGSKDPAKEARPGD